MGGGRVMAQNILYFPNPHAGMRTQGMARARVLQSSIKMGNIRLRYAYPFKTLIYLSLYILCIYLCSSM